MTNDSVEEIREELLRTFVRLRANAQEGVETLEEIQKKYGVDLSVTIGDITGVQGKFDEFYDYLSKPDSDPLFFRENNSDLLSVFEAKMDGFLTSVKNWSNASLES